MIWAWVRKSSCSPFQLSMAWRTAFANSEPVMFNQRGAAPGTYRFPVRLCAMRLRCCEPFIPVFVTMVNSHLVRPVLLRTISVISTPEPPSRKALIWPSRSIAARAFSCAFRPSSSAVCVACGIALNVASWRPRAASWFFVMLIVCPCGLPGDFWSPIS